MINQSLAILIALLLSGCAYKSVVINDPLASQPEGNSVFIEVEKNGESISHSVFGKTIKAHAIQWLTKRNYRVVNERKLAHNVVVFNIYSKERTVYIPAQTNLVPVYGNTGSNTDVLDAQGRNIGRLETRPANPFQPTGYQSVYREGHYATLHDKAILIRIWRQQYGYTPFVVSEGEFFPQKRKAAFFDHPAIMRKGTYELLGKSAFGDKDFEGEISNKPPGCWPMLGIVKGPSSTTQSDIQLTSFTPESKGEASGLRKGDIIRSIGGVPADKMLGNLKEGQMVEVIVARDGKDISHQVPVVMTCVEN